MEFSFKKHRMRLVEMLRDETKKTVSSLDVEFETSLKEIIKQQGSALSRRMYILLKGYRDVEIKN